MKQYYCINHNTMLKQTIQNKAYIPNTLIETMFMRIATDESMSTYLDYIKRGNIGLATAYASKLVYLKFMELVKYEK